MNSPTLHLPLLSRILSQPWAIRRETLTSWTPALLQPPHFATAVAKSKAAAPRTFAAGVIPLNDESECAAERSTFPASPDGITTLLVWGVLGRGWSEMERWWLDAIEVDELTAAVAATPEGSTVVLWFRSPGGIVTGIPETAAELRLLGKTRRLLAFTDDLCASAAYWLAAQCQTITATPTAEVGSIGVYLAYYDFCEMLDKAGVKLELFKAGDLKGTGVLGNPLDDKARAYLQAGVMDAYAQFTGAVLAMRALATETMQGQTLSGAEAKSANLIDAFSGSAAAFFASLSRGMI